MAEKECRQVLGCMNKSEFVAPLMIILFVLMLLMGLGVMPKWFVFEYAGVRLVVAGVAMTLLFYRVGRWLSSTI